MSRVETKTNLMGSTTQEPRQGFAKEIRPALGEVQAASAAVVEAVAASKGALAIRKASHLQQALEIPMTLAWQVFRLATVRDPMDEAETVPGSRSVQRLVKSARAKGVRDEPLDALLNSVQRFEALIKEVAGDRKTFNSIVAGLNKDEDADSMLGVRRAAFRANSEIRGVSVRTRTASYLIHPSSEDSADVLSVVGVVDLCRLRGESSFVFTSTSLVGGDRKERNFGHTLEPRNLSSQGGTVLTEFCSASMRSIRSYISDDNRLVTELSPQDLGKRHAVSAFVAEIYRDGDQRYGTDTDPTFSVKMQITMPTTTGVIDLIVADGVFGPVLPSPRGIIAMHPRFIPFTADKIGVNPEIEILERPDVFYLGQSSKALSTPDIPRYPEVFEHVCGRVGWNPGVFHIFRCRVEYPVMGSSLIVEFDKPRLQQDATPQN